MTHLAFCFFEDAGGSGSDADGQRRCGREREGLLHLTGVNPGREFTPALVGDLRQVTADDSCPHCGGALRLTEGIEVGHIFKLGTKYSAAMNATFQDADGQEKIMIMGCYGIGVSRVVAAAITAAAERLHQELEVAGIEVLYDDRDERPGSKFKDADLLGIPYLVTAGKGIEKDNTVELRSRRSGETTMLPLKQAAAELAAKIKAELTAAG